MINRPGRKSEPEVSAPQNNAASGTRLNKAVAGSGLCARRKADELIFAGRVSVNGEVETRRGKKLVDGDVVFFEGETIRIVK